MILHILFISFVIGFGGSNTPNGVFQTCRRTPELADRLEQNVPYGEVVGDAQGSQAAVAFKVILDDGGNGHGQI